MTIAHLAAGSVIDKISHAAVWLDGAIGFVTLSGVVLGIVYRRTHDRTGRIPYRKVLRRARLLYVIQFVTLALALAVSAVSTRPVGVGRPEEFGGWTTALGMVATMRLPAAYLDVLPMYVVLLLAAAPALALLSRGRTRSLLAMSGVVYVLATVFPDVAVLPGVHFNWAAWQLPFVIGLTVGWQWESRNLAARLRERRVVLSTVAVTAVFFLTAQAFGRLGLMAGTRLDDLVGAAFAKFNLGPAHVVFGLAGMAAGYAMVSAVRDRGLLVHVRGWLSVLGSRSLDAFVILCLAVIAFPALLGYESSSVTAMLLVLLTLGVQTGWIVLRRRGHLPGLATGTIVPRPPGLVRRFSRAAQGPRASA